MYRDLKHWETTTIHRGQIQKDASQIYHDQGGNLQNRFLSYQTNSRQSVIIPGIIRSVVIIGEDLYAICTYSDKDHPIFGKHFGKTMGNIRELEDITLAEIMIPVDLPPFAIRKNPDELIGREVDVVFGARGKYPKYVMLNNVVGGIRGEAFNITSEDINRARAQSPDNKLDTDEARTFLLSIGYSDEQIDGLLAMSADPGEKDKLNGKVFGTGGPSPYDTYEDDIDGQIILSEESLKIVKNPPVGKLKRKQCYLPPKMFKG